MHIEENDKETGWCDALMDHIVVRSAEPDEAHSAEKSLSRLMRRIRADHASVELFRRRIAGYRIWLAAAMVALVVSIGGWWYAAHDAEPLYLVATNHAEVVKDITLPDGTTIKLNCYSRLVYPEKFSGQTREIFLDGEAYFDVAHDKKHPFIVRAGELNIRVLGTKFTVNAYPQNPQIVATLLEGSIKVSDKEQQMQMTPNQQLLYSVNDGSMRITELEDAKRAMRWTENVWVISNTPLLDICLRLERQFNVKFIIMNDDLKNKLFTGEFYASDSLESILKTMQISTPFEFEKEGNNIVIK